MPSLAAVDLARALTGLTVRQIKKRIGWTSLGRSDARNGGLAECVRLITAAGSECLLEERFQSRRANKYLSRSALSN